MKKVCIQVQSILYNNEKESVVQAVAAMANAVRVYKKRNRNDSITLIFKYGDSSKKPVFTAEDIEELNNKYGSLLTLSYVFFNFNSGTAKGHNLLAEGFAGDYYIVMNPDVKVSPHFLVEILKPVDKDKKVGLVEARQTPLEHQKMYDPDTFETEWATTACVLIRKTAFDQVNGFDAETFFLYCDDLDFSWRLRLEGWKLIYQPLAPVYHAKKLDNNAKWIPTNAEVYYSALANILMAYKWSNGKRVAVLTRQFLSMGGEYARAVKEYQQMRNEKRLPKQLDPMHKVSRFVGDYYTENRFVL